jgi:peroxiredoxin
VKNIRWINLILFISFLVSVTSCQPENKPFKVGRWRGAFNLRGNEIPFVFEVKGKGTESASLFLINGEDRFEIKNIMFENDSVSIPIDLYDVILKGKLTDNTFEGQFIKTGSDMTIIRVPFIAEYGSHPRFPMTNETPSASMNGTWDMDIIYSGNADKTVGYFNQKGSVLTGSILDISGDYRFLEGVIQGRKFWLSAFGGSTPYLVKGEFLNDSTFSGEFVTLRRTSKLVGRRNANATLPDPYTASHLKDGYSSIAFSFPNLEGKQVSLADPQYRDKVVIVTIMGSWCPNCLDENVFLSDWYNTNRWRGVEIIGLGFERKNDFESAKKSLSNLKARLDIQYELLFAGKSGTESASKSLPALNRISAFPTTIFIDKKGNVRKVHTGFNGPATGKFYEEFKIEFNGLIDQLLAEK